MSCKPLADCIKIIKLNESFGEIKMLKPSQDEFDFQFTLTVKVRLKV